MLLNTLLYLPILGLPFLIFLILDIKGNAKIALPALLILLAYFAVIGYLFGLFPYTPLWFFALTAISLLINTYLGSADKILLIGAAFVIPNSLIWFIIGFASLIFLIDNYGYKKHGVYKFSSIAYTKEIPMRMQDGSIKVVKANKVLYAPYLLMGLLIVSILAVVYAFMVASTSNIPYAYKPLCINNANNTITCFNKTQLIALGYNVSALYYQNGIYYLPLYYNTT